jgi:glycine/D-amino acid oxidase-like deaminating enzyme
VDLYSGTPYWLSRHGFITPYSSLEKSSTCDVAIIGAGISGALIALQLHNAGFSVTVIDKRHVAFGSTASSTALLQYELDIHLVHLRKQIGRQKADRCYELCHTAVEELITIAHTIAPEAHLLRKQSLYLCSSTAEIEDLKMEAEARNELGISCDFLDMQQIKEAYGIDAHAALLSAQAAEVDPVLLTHAIFDHLKNVGVKIFDKTELIGIREDSSGAVLACSTGASLNCRKFVFATGYESLPFVNNMDIDLKSTYAICSKELNKKDLQCFTDVMIWETKRPYLYMRATHDNRIIVGGADEPFADPHSRDALLSSKATELKNTFGQLFPSIPFITDFEWCGVFAESKDALPYIGKPRDYKHAYCAIGCGGNGITFSQVAAKIITEMCLGREGSDAQLFLMER